MLLSSLCPAATGTDRSGGGPSALQILPVTTAARVCHASSSLPLGLSLGALCPMTRQSIASPCILWPGLAKSQFRCLNLHLQSG